MGMSVGGQKRGIVSEMNVVPLIDILLVLLVIFMIIPHTQVGLDTVLPQASQTTAPPKPDVDVVVVQVLDDGTLRLNQEPVKWDTLRSRLEEVFKMRASRVAFVRGQDQVKFEEVARVIDIMRAAGVTSVGLLTPELEKSNGT
jgi:biopolymer transport protein TolR